MIGLSTWRARLLLPPLVERTKAVLTG